MQKDKNAKLQKDKNTNRQQIQKKTTKKQGAQRAPMPFAGARTRGAIGPKVLVY